QTYAATNYWVDVVFDDDNHAAPRVIDRHPAPGVGCVALGGSIWAAFDEPVAADTDALRVTGPGGPVAGALDYDAASRTLRFQPDAPLAPATTYTVTVDHVADASGTTLDAPVVWTFTTASLPGALPASLWT